MENLIKFNKCFPDSKYRKIAPYYEGDNHSEYQRSKAPVDTKIYTFDEIKNTKNRIGWIVPKEYIAVDLDDLSEAAKLYNILSYFKVKCVWMVSKHGGHFIFKNKGNYNQGANFVTSIGLTIDIRSQEKGYIILPYNDKDRKWGMLSEDIDELPFYLRPLKRLKLLTDLVDLEEGSRNNELLRHFLSLKDYADELNVEEKVESIKIINKFILKEPLEERDLMSTVLRDEMIERVAEADESSDGEKKPSIPRAVRLEKISSKVITDYRIITVNDIIHLYNGKYYEDKTDLEIHRIIHENYDKFLIESDRNEIIKFIKLKTYVKPSELNKNWNEIVLKNGVLNLSNMKLYEHNPSTYNTIYIDVNWNPKVTYSPLIDSYMNQISNNDEEDKKLLYEIIGYCLLQKPVFSKMFLLYGGGGTGKSTFLNIIRKLIGDKYCSFLTLSDLEKDFMPAELFGKLVNLGDDIDAKILTDTGMLKSLISGEAVNVRRIYKEPFSFNNFAKLIFTCNKLPVINDRTSGLYRRLCIVEINNKIKKFDPFFLLKITDDDMEYLLYRSVDALIKALEKNSLTENEKMLKSIEMFKVEQSSVLSFLRDSGLTDKEIHLAPVQTIYDIYVQYCGQVGYKPLSRANFGSELCEAKSFEIVNTTHNGDKQCRRFKKNPIVSST